MIRIEPLEKTLPKDWRRTVREHPWLSLSAAVIAGVYLGAITAASCWRPW